MKAKNFSLQPTALLAELLGTFALTLAALTSGGNALVVGFTLIVLVFGIGAISGAHVNPAVTFGLWSTRKIGTLKVPFYWAMQFAGALLALLTVQLFQNDGYGLSLASFGNFDMKIVVAELVGVAIFTFVVAAAMHRQLAEAAKGLAIGLALFAGLAIATGLLEIGVQNADSSENQAEAPRVTKVTGAVINPAIALAVTEKDVAAEQNALLQQYGQQVPEAEETTTPSRFTFETVVAGLVGGALGMNLYHVAAGVNPFAREKQTVAAKVTKTTKVAARNVTKTAKRVAKKAKK